MCGLTGFARPNNSDSLPFAKKLFTSLMEATESRGTHATGVAACGGQDPWIWKAAEKASVVIQSEAWDKVMNGIGPDTTIVMGHTRWATHQNADKDEAAHPFQMGRVVGAHNGHINNWKEIEKQVGGKNWMVDSQAAFALLDKMKKADKALEALRGTFALTWVKNNNLYVARNSNPLSMAFIFELRLLVWNSERNILMKALWDAGVKAPEYDVWDAQVGTVYRYVPSMFADRATNVQKIENAFKAAYNASWQDNRQYSKGVRSTTTWKNGVKQTTYHYPGGSSWDAEQAREVFDSCQRQNGRDERRSLPPASSAQLTLRETMDLLVETQERVERLEQVVRKLDRENGWMWEIIAQSGMLSEFEETLTEADAIRMRSDLREGPSDESDTVTVDPNDKPVSAQAALIEEIERRIADDDNGDDLPGTVTLEDIEVRPPLALAAGEVETTPAAGQADGSDFPYQTAEGRRSAVLRDSTAFDVTKCRVCQEDDPRQGRLIDYAGGEVIHTECLFVH